MDLKITGLTADTSPTSDDLIPTVNDPAGTPANRKVTLANAITKAHGLSDGIVKVASGTMGIASAGTDYQAAGNYITALTSDVTASGPGSAAATIANDAVTNAKLANMATQTIKGRTTAGTGDPEDLTATQATAILNAFTPDTGTGGVKGLVPAPAAGDASKFLKGDGTFASIPGGGDALVANPLSQFAATTSLQLKGVISDETGSGALVFGTSPTIDTPTLTLKQSAAPTPTAEGAIEWDTDDNKIIVGDGAAQKVFVPTASVSGDATMDTAGAVTIANDAVTYAKMQNVSATDKVLGRSTAGAGDVEEIACTAAGRALIDDANAAAQRTTLGLENVQYTFTFGDGTNAIVAGAGYDVWVRAKEAMTITGVELTADASSSAVLDIWVDTYANFPPTVADTITASAKPTLSSATKYQDTTLTGWTTTIAKGSYIKVHIDSSSTAKRLVLCLYGTNNQ